MPSWTRKNGSAMSRNWAASLINLISRNPSSSDASSLWAAASTVSPGERRGECPPGRAAEAEDSLSISRAYACAERPNRFRPSSNGLFRRRSVGVAAEQLPVCQLVTNTERDDFAVPASRRKRAGEPRRDRRHAGTLGKRHQRKVDPQPALEGEAQFDRHQRIHSHLRQRTQWIDASSGKPQDRRRLFGDDRLQLRQCLFRFEGGEPIGKRLVDRRG